MKITNLSYSIDLCLWIICKCLFKRVKCIFLLMNNWKCYSLGLWIIYKLFRNNSSFRSRCKRKKKFCNVSNSDAKTKKLCVLSNEILSIFNKKDNKNTNKRINVTLGIWFSFDTFIGIHILFYVVFLTVILDIPL